MVNIAKVSVLWYRKIPQFIEIYLDAIQTIVSKKYQR